VSVVHCSSIPEFRRLLRRDIRKLERKLRGAIRETSRDAVWRIRDRTPKAFGELRQSIHAVSNDSEAGVVAVTTVAAPHAAAVEVGSRPHVVPLDVLIRWVKLRGMQGLTSKGRLKTRYGMKATIGTTTAGHARSVAAALKRLERGGSLGTGAPEQVARAIQARIAKVGTKPHWYVRDTLPEIERVLHVRIAEACR